MMRERGMTTQQWSKDKSAPGLMSTCWSPTRLASCCSGMHVSDAVYLGGATAEGIGGHNPVEPVQLGKRVFTGPHGFNFREMFEALEKTGALVVGAPIRSYRTTGSALSMSCAACAGARRVFCGVARAVRSRRSTRSKPCCHKRGDAHA
jgi:3-deoxy-D-manno-octulosonic-acid transferase